MTYKLLAPENSTIVPRKYQLLEPIKVKIKQPSGEVTTTGFGIGEIIEVMEPSIIYCVTPCEKLSEIELSNGSFIVEFPDEIKARRFYD